MGKKLKGKHFEQTLLLKIELKAIERLADVHYRQVNTYLNLTSLKLGLLINFNEALIKNGIHRIVNKLE